MKFKGEMSALKNDLVEISNQYFEIGNEQIYFLYLGLDLSQKYLSKVVRNGQLVDDEEVPPSGEVAQTEHVVHKATQYVLQGREGLQENALQE